MVVVALGTLVFSWGWYQRKVAARYPPDAAAVTAAGVLAAEEVEDGGGISPPDLVLHGVSVGEEARALVPIQEESGEEAEGEVSQALGRPPSQGRVVDSGTGGSSALSNAHPQQAEDANDVAESQEMAGSPARGNHVDLDREGMAPVLLNPADDSAGIVPTSDVSAGGAEGVPLRPAGLTEDRGNQENEGVSILATATAPPTAASADAEVAGRGEGESSSLERVATMRTSSWQGLQVSGGGVSPTSDLWKGTGGAEAPVGAEEGGGSSLKRASTLPLFPQETCSRVGGLPCIQEESPQPAGALDSELVNSLRNCETWRRLAPGPLGGPSLWTFVQQRWRRGEIWERFSANLAEAFGAQAAVLADGLPSSPWIIGKNIGHGASGRIDVATQAGSGAKYALKTLKVRQDTAL